MKPTADDLMSFMRDPQAFRDALVVPLSGGRMGQLGPSLTDWQRADLAALDSALLAVRSGTRPDVSRFWWERVKGSSKTSDVCVALLWLLAFCPRFVLCQVAAGDEEQASEALKVAKQVVRANAWLAQVLDVQSSAVVNKRTGSRLDCLSSNAPTAHGARPTVVWIDEYTHVQTETGREFVANLLDNAAKTGALVIVTTNAGWVPSPQWDAREHARTSEAWYFSAVTSPAPWIAAAEVAEAQRRNPPARFLRLWRGVWSTGDGDALDREDLEAAYTLSGPPDPSEPGWLWWAGLDLGLTRDASALVVVGKHVGFDVTEEAPAPRRSVLVDLGFFDEAPPPDRTVSTPGTGRLRLGSVQTWKPVGGRKLDLEAVEDAVREADQRFGLACVAYDTYQCAYMGERLVKAGVFALAVDPTAPNLRAMASAVLTAFSDRTVDLWPDPALKADLGALRVEEKSYGVRLTSPRGPSGHGDAATAFSLAMLAASRSVGPTEVQGELVCW